MYTKKIFTILGGDKRQGVVARRLIERGHTVRIWGMETISDAINGAEVYSNWKNALNGCELLLLPLPVSRDGVHLSLSCEPDKKEAVKLCDIAACAARCGCEYIIGGVMPRIMCELAEETRVDAIDFYMDENLQINNALPSAEGALMLAMEHTDKIIKDMPILISGYGRIGSCLAHILDKMGADVTVAARRDESLCDAVLSGYKTVRLGNRDPDELINTAKSCDVIFNTVPHQIFTNKIISEMTNKPLYIEIASAPGGIDLCGARDMGLEIVFAPSIPGKYAPLTAGEYIFKSINDILKKRGIDL